MTGLSEIEQRNPTTAQRAKVILNAAINLAGVMEKVQRILKEEKLNTASLFVTPPGNNQWHPAMLRFVYPVTEICQCRGVDFAICTPNMRVSSRDLHPCWLSYMGYIASVPKIVQSVETIGDSQMTLDNAFYFDHSTRMALLMFDAEEERRLSKPTTAECEAVRLHIWMEPVRSSVEKTSIKTELSEVTAQMEKVSEFREIERAFT